MIGYKEYSTLKDLERRAEALGFELATPYYGTSGALALHAKSTVDPADEPLPIYARDSDIFIGSAEELGACLTGWDRALQYCK